MVDFALGRVPDFAKAALSGYEAGRKIGRERRTEAAIKKFQTDPEAGIRSSSFDPKLSEELRTINNARKTRQLTADALGSGQAGQSLNMDSLRELAKVDIGMATNVYQFAQKATDDDLKLAADHAEIKGQAAAYLEGIPEGPERTAAFEALKPELAQRGFKPEALAQARLDNVSLKQDQALGTSLKDLIEQKRIRYQSIGEGGLQGFDHLGNPVGGNFGAPAPEPALAPEPSPAPYSNPERLSQGSIPATGRAIEEKALSVFPGTVVTSRARSVERNNKVGGTANSYHLTDQARDFTPPRGVSMNDLANGLRSSMPGFDVINEGDHVHVEPGPRRAAQQAPKQHSREAILAEARRRGLIK